jgi:hypothetical protein
MKIPAVNEWIVIANNAPGWKVVFDVFDQDMFTMLSPYRVSPLIQYPR